MLHLSNLQLLGTGSFDHPHSHRPVRGGQAGLFIGIDQEQRPIFFLFQMPLHPACACPLDSLLLLSKQLGIKLVSPVA
jgi:hypothetical protein